MGQVASSGVNNYSFFNKKPAIESPAELGKYQEALKKTRADIASGSVVYDSNNTYMMFILGDGDNTAFMKGGRRGWMHERQEYCKERGGCERPLSWSMSPHLLYLAPDWLAWYYAQANETGADVFILPPSGHLYAYPGMMHVNESIQDTFIEDTDKDCDLLWATGSVHWEWFTDWANAFTIYFPKYAQGEHCVTSFFATNVPYLMQPDEEQWPLEEFYRVVGDRVVVFKPREWRGINVGSVPDLGLNFLSAEDMAAEINSYPRGSVSHLYITSDGGMNLALLHSMLELLEDHVQVVNHEELTEMARQRTHQMETLNKVR